MGKIPSLVYTNHLWLRCRGYTNCTVFTSAVLHEMLGEWRVHTVGLHFKHDCILNFFSQWNIFIKYLKSRPCVYTPPLFMASSLWGNDCISRTESVFGKMKKVTQRRRKTGKCGRHKQGHEAHPYSLETKPFPPGISGETLTGKLTTCCRIGTHSLDYKLFLLAFFFFLIGVLELGRADCWVATASLEIWKLMHI